MDIISDAIVGPDHWSTLQFDCLNNYIDVLEEAMQNSDFIQTEYNFLRKWRGADGCAFLNETEFWTFSYHICKQLRCNPLEI